MPSSYIKPFSIDRLVTCCLGLIIATAETVCEPTLAIAQENCFAQTDMAMAIALTSARRYREAIPSAASALEAAQNSRGTKDPCTIFSLTLLGRLYSHIGDDKEALQWLERAVSAAKSGLGLRHRLTLAGQNDLGTTYLALGRYEEAIDLLRETLKISEEAGVDTELLAMIINNVALANRRLGLYREALILYRRAEKLLREGHADPVRLALVLDNIGSMLDETEQLEESLKYREEAFDLLMANAPRSRDAMITLQNLATVSQHLKRFDDALAYHYAWLEVAPEILGQTDPLLVVGLDNMGQFFYLIGDLKRALEIRKKAVELMAQNAGANHPDTATALVNLGGLESRAGRYAEAEKNLRRAAQILGDLDPGKSTALSRLAVTYRRMKRYEDSLRSFQAAVDSEDRILINGLAIASEEQKLLFFQKRRETYDGYLSLLIDRFRDRQEARRAALDLVLRRKGLVLGTELLSRRAMADALTEESRASWERLIQYQSALSHLYYAGRENKDWDKGKEQLELGHKIEEEKTFLAQHMVNAIGAFLPETITAARVAERLPGDTALVEFVKVPIWDDSSRDWALRSRYVVFVLDNKGAVTALDLGPEDTIDGAITEALTEITASSRSVNPLVSSLAADEKLHTLYELAFRKLEPALVGKKVIVISPDGEFNRISFAALVDMEKRYLVERFSIVYVTTGRDLLVQSERPARSGLDLVAVANPSYDDSLALSDASENTDAFRHGESGLHFDPLPSTAGEARAVSEAIPGSHLILSETAATEEAVRALAAPKIVHFATHGFFREDVETSREGVGRKFSSVNAMIRSGLALAGANHAIERTTGYDGLLTALEVTSMNFRGTKLVVLSACQTGVGSARVGQGVYGLRRAFVLAGAQYLVMSLWDVSGRSAKTIEAFYAIYAKESDPVKALTAAQRAAIVALREKAQAEGHAMAPVWIWAPFIVQASSLPEGN